MPDRILRDYTTSEKFDGFPGSPETLFTRLLTKVDDYGRFDGDPVNVRGATYPRAESLRANTVDAWLKELSDHHLLLCYQVGGKKYLAIINFRQRLRTSGQPPKPPKPKFPPPDGKPFDFRPDDGDWRALMDIVSESPRVAASGKQCPPYAESVTESVASAKPSASLPTNADGLNGPSGDSKGGQRDVASNGAARGKPPVTNGHTPVERLLELPAIGRVARAVLDSDWCWDNCRVRPEMFSQPHMAVELHPYVGRIREAAVIPAFKEAVIRAHQQCVDKQTTADPVRKPGGQAIVCFREQLENATKKQP